MSGNAETLIANVNRGIAPYWLLPTKRRNLQFLLMLRVIRDALNDLMQTEQVREQVTD